MRRDNDWRAYGPYKHGDLWRVHYVRRKDDGKRETKYSTHAGRTAADLELAGARDETQGTTVMQAVDAFLDKKRDGGLVESTIDNYRFRLRMMLGLPANAERPIRFVVKRGVELYAAALVKVDKRRANDTQLNGLGVARMWGAYCVKEKLLKANPFADVERVGRKRRGADKSRLTVNESRQLEAFCFEHSHNPDCVLTYGYLMLGKRASEIVGATVRDLDDDGRLLRIRKAKTAASVGTMTLSPELREMLMSLAKDRPANAHLFVNQSDEPMSRFVARVRVKAICKAAGVPELPPQALRRTFTDNASRQGIALTSIAEMVGHTSTAVTRRSYASADQLDAAQVERNFKVIQGGQR